MQVGQWTHMPRFSEACPAQCTLLQLHLRLSCWACNGVSQTLIHTCRSLLSLSSSAAPLGPVPRRSRTAPAGWSPTTGCATRSLGATSPTSEPGASWTLCLKLRHDRHAVGAAAHSPHCPPITLFMQTRTFSLWWHQHAAGTRTMSTPRLLSPTGTSLKLVQFQTA